MDTFILIDQLPGASDALRALAQQGVPRTYAKGRMLIEEADTGDTLFIILSGRLRAFASADNGRQITYGHYGPGEYVGEMSLDGGLRSASVEATERCVCAVITRRTLETFIAEHPAFAFELLAKVIRRARAATLSARQMALNDVYGRLRIALDELAEPFEGQQRIIRERVTHQDLANRIGCSREMVSRIVKDLERGGHVRIEDRRIIIVRDPPPRW